MGLRRDLRPAGVPGRPVGSRAHPGHGNRAGRDSSGSVPNVFPGGSWIQMSFTMSVPLATHDHVAGELSPTFEFLKRTRWELRFLRKARVWTDRFQIIDVNGDAFEVRGVGYPDTDVVPLLRAVNTAFDPQTIHDPTDQPFKEFDTGRRHTWAEDRVM